MSPSSHWKRRDIEGWKKLRLSLCRSSFFNDHFKIMVTVAWVLSKSFLLSQANFGKIKILWLHLELKFYHGIKVKRSHLILILMMRKNIFLELLLITRSHNLLKIRSWTCWEFIGNWRFHTQPLLFFNVAITVFPITHLMRRDNFICHQRVFRVVRGAYCSWLLQNIFLIFERLWVWIFYIISHWCLLIKMISIATSFAVENIIVDLSQRKDSLQRIFRRRLVKLILVLFIKYHWLILRLRSLLDFFQRLQIPLLRIESTLSICKEQALSSIGGWNSLLSLKIFAVEYRLVLVILRRFRGCLKSLFWL